MVWSSNISSSSISGLTYKYWNELKIIHFHNRWGTRNISVKLKLHLFRFVVDCCGFVVQIHKSSNVLFLVSGTNKQCVRYESSQNYVPPVPFASKNGGHVPQLLWKRRPCIHLNHTSLLYSRFVCLWLVSGEAPWPRKNAPEGHWKLCLRLRYRLALHKLAVIWLPLWRC